MHRSHPDDNWRLIDKQNRKINTDKVLSIREQISRSPNQEKLIILKLDYQGMYKVSGLKEEVIILQVELGCRYRF